MSRKTVTLERNFNATLDEVWDLWTTPRGIEAWWGPEGFTVTVQKLELQRAGELLYTMTATRPQEVAFMKGAGMPLSTAQRVVFREVTPKTCLRWSSAVDFVPGVTAYDVEGAVVLQHAAGVTQVQLTLDAMHDDLWTNRAVMGWESQLGKLEHLLNNGKSK